MVTQAIARAYLLDLDGTLYADGAPIAGGPGALARLRKQGVPFRLVTNTTGRSRSMLVQRLEGYGFAVAAGEIFTATLAGAELAQASGYTCIAPFTPEAAFEDLAILELVGGTSGRAVHRVPDAILVGDLGDQWSFGLMQEAFEYLVNGADLIAFSRDRYWLKEGRLTLDAGAFVAGLEYAAGKAARVAGKPSPHFFRAAVRSLGPRPPSSVAMVGDDLWSDVEGAQRAGLEGWLVRTGKFRESVLRDSGIRPDRILESVAALP
jgi:phospholysine phosphohistidine inorganic pyrophosphate phosphatase